MTWVVLDDKMPEHPKNVGLSDGAFRLHVSGICYCNRHLTDGIISADMVAQLMPRYRKSFLDEPAAAGRLGGAGAGRVLRNPRLLGLEQEPRRGVAATKSEGRRWPEGSSPPMATPIGEPIGVPMGSAIAEL